MPSKNAKDKIEVVGKEMMEIDLNGIKTRSKEQYLFSYPDFLRTSTDCRGGPSFLEFVQNKSKWL